MITGDHIALLVHAQAAVGIAVVGKAHIQVILDNELLQMLDMGASAVCIDVVAIGLVVHHVGLRAQGIKYALGDGPCGAICHIQTNLHVLEAELGHGDQVADVTVTAFHIVDRTSNLSGCQRDLNAAVDVLLYLQDRLLIHLLSVSVQQLDAVVIVRIVGGADHDAAVKIVNSCDIGDRRCRRYMHDVGICAGSHQAGAEGILKHIGGPSCVLSDDDLCLLTLILTIVPAQEAANLYSMLVSQTYVCFSAKTVSSEIFTHGSVLDLSDYLCIVLVNAALRDHTTHAAGRIDIAVPADDGAGIQDGIAADLDIIAQHGAELFQSGLDLLVPVVDHDKLLVRLDVRRDGAGSHVTVIAKNGITDIVVVRGLHVVKQDHVLQLHRVADHTVCAYQR